jgi:hypothetical protein
MSPEDNDQACNFLGLANFYRRFELGFSNIYWVLSHVTKGGLKAKFVWSIPKQKAFEDLKFFLCIVLLLIILDMQQPFEIETDASYYAIGAVLSKHGHPISYHSENLSNVI